MYEVLFFSDGKGNKPAPRSGERVPSSTPDKVSLSGSLETFHEDGAGSRETSEAGRSATLLRCSKVGSEKQQQLALLGVHLTLKKVALGVQAVAGRN